MHVFRPMQGVSVTSSLLEQQVSAHAGDFSLLEQVSVYVLLIESPASLSLGAQQESGEARDTTEAHEPERLAGEGRRGPEQQESWPN